ncbi:DUF4468 domain-containing protein [Flavobacterium kingsejongi]|uniref:Uncharacterized protein n=1 Tax=Flavobacterium kingsejongi TaxID=1678728 RepID=A0A2S1LRZ5_9FLAO|nr:DUF4468 domain-containing protein [Flavobacterium kingsejongi]AWG26458.1 hypothetical protein FK004_15115 [Flavobacterium kingsejongi]
MRTKILLLFFFYAFTAAAQQKMVLTAKGFEPLKVEVPQNSAFQIFTNSKDWMRGYYQTETEFQEIEGQQLTIDAFKNNAFFFRSLGETYYYKIKYNLKIEFVDGLYTFYFRVDEIYTINTLTKTQIADYFLSNGNIKDDYADVKSSLEYTVNAIARSHYNYVFGI